MYTVGPLLPQHAGKRKPTFWQHFLDVYETLLVGILSCIYPSYTVY